MNYKLFRILRKDLGFIVAAYCFLHREKFFNFDKVEHWNLIVSRYWWEISPVLEYVGSWKKRVVVVENGFWRMNFQSSKLLLLYDFNRFLPASIGQPFLFLTKLQKLPYMGGVFFFGDLVQVLNLFCFSVICSEQFLQTTYRLIRGLRFS